MLETAAHDAAHPGLGAAALIEDAEREAEKIREEARAEAASIIRVARDAAAQRIDRLGRTSRSRTSRLAFVSALVVAGAAGAAGWAVMSGSPAPAAPVSPPVPAKTAASSLCPIPSFYRSAFVSAARRENVPLSLLTAVASVESRWQLGSVSARGAVGPMQLLPSTARALGVNPFDWRQNILGGARFLRMLLSQYRGNTEFALAAYDSGQYSVAQGAVPLETVDYVGAVMQKQASIAGCR